MTDNNKNPLIKEDNRVFVFIEPLMNSKDAKNYADLPDDKKHLIGKDVLDSKTVEALDKLRAFTQKEGMHLVLRDLNNSTNPERAQVSLAIFKGKEKVLREEVNIKGLCDNVIDVVNAKLVDQNNKTIYNNNKMRR
ncbi:TPA: hypothetical protein ACK3Q6_002659 [Burkholderia cepacia]|uniref:hypothetical protein n=1 Tax=Burkholderia cepacia TaxID=292 RepID=UPI001CF2961B|nr:hypothetical protein [Burkholderia cepacia]HDR9771156.1 hypothetical protein [Burkholderia cepacia ATCC 25416]MCA8361232.1 hypothetical protein [Burkholderia cepacia]HDR9779727.1 hypothetical protein [Burkholderia cepacia ATCC 25416]HDR9785810.1 hypothetical protein [Burkholderia cepacia ATCC 25416]HDR9794661.1 hypothetical protein [Burkholderia cepacia ATCC 25416]